MTPASWEDLEGVGHRDRAWHSPTLLFYARSDYVKVDDLALPDGVLSDRARGQRRPTPGPSSADLWLVSSLRRELARQQGRPLDQQGSWIDRKADPHQQQACCTRRPIGKLLSR